MFWKMLPAIIARNIGCFVVRTHGWDEVWEKARDPAIWQASYERFVVSEALIHSFSFIIYILLTSGKPPAAKTALTPGPQFCLSMLFLTTNTSDVAFFSGSFEMPLVLLLQQSLLILPSITITWKEPLLWRWAYSPTLPTSDSVLICRKLGEDSHRRWKNIFNRE